MKEKTVSLATERKRSGKSIEAGLEPDEFGGYEFEATLAWTSRFVVHTDSPEAAVEQAWMVARYIRGPNDKVVDVRPVRRGGRSP